MLYPLSTFALAPVLIGQGRYVRRVTPSLQEPEGERQGSLGEGPELRVLILGDSAAAAFALVSGYAGQATEHVDGKLLQ